MLDVHLTKRKSTKTLKTAIGSFKNVLFLFFMHFVLILRYTIPCIFLPPPPRQLIRFFDRMTTPPLDFNDIQENETTLKPAKISKLCQTMLANVLIRI